MRYRIQQGGGAMKNITGRVDRYLTNNGRFHKSDAWYRKMYVLNVILTGAPIICLFFAIVDLFVFKTPLVAAGNALSAAVTLGTLLYFRKTNRYRPAAYTTVAILLLFFACYFLIVQNQHYAFFWLAVMPPIIYFLLERRAARIVLGAFGVYMLTFFAYNLSVWPPAAFDVRSVFNISGAAVSLLSMIVCFEKSREEAWRELEKLNRRLSNNQDELRLILDSAAEAIYGMDLDGNCTFCNKSCIQMLGYADPSELLGKNMHTQIHHTRKDGTPFPIDDCRIIRASLAGERAHVEDEVFWRADGTCFDVEYFSYPQIKDGEITGSVITFMDISERKRREAVIQYLNCYDTLTGLYNRRYFEESRVTIDTPDNLPLSVIFADINGLKMINDIFGHSAGDALIKKSSEILRQVCRKNDLAARIGGDEFVILLPKTTREEAKKILAEIRSELTIARIQAIKCSISLGLDIKQSPGQSLNEIMANAENAMYKDKTMNRSAVNRDMIDTIIETLHARNDREKQHSLAVSALSSEVGAALQLPETEISKLKRAGYLHDIGKIVFEENTLAGDAPPHEEPKKMQQHSVVGYRILNLFDDTLDLAEYVYGHHESWDGTGYPRGLKGEQIPLLSRIIAVVESYDRAMNRGELPLKERKAAALNAVQRNAGTRFDPKIAEVFLRMMAE